MSRPIKPHSILRPSSSLLRHPTSRRQLRPSPNVSHRLISLLKPHRPMSRPFSHQPPPSTPHRHTSNNPHPRTPLLNLTASSLLTATTLILTLHIISTYIFSISPTYGISMLPTIPSSGAWVLIDKYFRRGRDVKVGDLVSFQHPVVSDMRAIKRVVGIEGDFVVRDTPGTGVVGLDTRRRHGDGDGEGVDGGGIPHHHSALRGQMTMMIQVPKGHVYVVGDNLHHSRDSRMFGPLPLALVRGKVTYMFGKWWWPTKVPDGLVDVQLGDDE